MCRIFYLLHSAHFKKVLDFQISEIQPVSNA